MHIRLFMALGLSVMISAYASAEMEGATVSVGEADSTLLTLYPNKTLVRQRFSVKPSGDGFIRIEGMPTDWLENSLEVDYRDNNKSQLPEKLWWHRGGLDRDVLYRKLIGKNVEVVGGGLNVPVLGTLLAYDRGVALVQGNNGNQYLVDIQDAGGFRVIPRDSLFTEADYQPFLHIGFGKKTVSGHLRLAYSTPSLRYSSHYRLTLEQKGMARLELKMVLTNNTDTDYNNARVRLVSGDTGAPPAYAREMVMFDAVSASPKAGYAERVGEVLVSALPDTTNIPARSSQQVSLYSENSLKLEKVYVLDTYGRSWSSSGQALERPRLSYRFKVADDLPAGAVDIFEEDPEGNLMISGHAHLPQTTSGDTARLTMGEALTVRVERSRVDRSQKNGNELIVQWQATIYNDQNESATLLLADHDRSLLRLDNVTNASLEAPSVLRVKIPAGDKKTISYSAVYNQ